MTYNPDFDIKKALGESCEQDALRLMGTFSRGDPLTFEVKDDTKARHTGNACLEFWQADWQTGGFKPSGLQVTKADYWIHRVYGGTYDGWYLFAPVAGLRLVSEEYQRSRGRSLTPGDLTATGDNGNRSLCIPLRELVLPWQWLRASATRNLVSEAR